MAAENYHLKWDSHQSYLNSSVATLYKNEKFADVMLYSSSHISNENTNHNGNDGGNAIPTVGIAAHKFILSSCSQFFATMLESSPIASPNGILYIVLPPELSHRAIQILVQYMYSGEATVSNDILCEVLRGGELLKIRGLCRTAATQHPPISTSTSTSNYSTNDSRTILTPTHTNHSQSQSQTQSQNQNIANASHTKDVYHAKSHSSRSTVEQQQQARNLGASVMPKDSPVIVKSPKVTMQHQSGSKHSNINHNISSGGNGGSGGGITVNKEVAIDPDDKYCYIGNQSANEENSMCTAIGCNSCSLSPSVEVEHIRRRQRRQSDSHMVPHHVSNAERQQQEHGHYHEMRTMSDNCNNLNEHDALAAERTLEYGRGVRRNSDGNRCTNFYAPDSYEHSSTSSKHFIDSINSIVASPPDPHQHQHFPTIKQEPRDWTNCSTMEGNNSSDGGTGGGCSSSRTNGRDRNRNRGSGHGGVGSGIVDAHKIPSRSSVYSPKRPLDFKMPVGTIKIESGTMHTTGEEEPCPAVSQPNNDYDTFRRLVCNICNKPFDDPKAWVQHLEAQACAVHENHRQLETNAMNCDNGMADTLTKSHVPKKKRRISQQENSVDHVTLLCDICSTSFETPAEWVRHMNNRHTEIELAIFNSKKDGEQQKSKCHSGASHQSKKLSTRSSCHGFMMYSDRTCDTCNKKFSSNANMLLHKRTHSNVNVNGNSSMTKQQSNGISNRE